MVFVFRLKFVIRPKFKTKQKYGGHKFVTAVYMFRPKFKPNHKFKTKHKYHMNPTYNEFSRFPDNQYSILETSQDQKLLRSGMGKFDHKKCPLSTFCMQSGKSCAKRF